MLTIDSQEPKSDSQSLISTPRRPKLRVYSILTMLDKKRKDKNANLHHLRRPDMRSDTIFTALDERRKGKGKFTPTDTFRSEIRYYYYPLEKRLKMQIYSI